MAFAAEAEAMAPDNELMQRRLGCEMTMGQEGPAQWRRVTSGPPLYGTAAGELAVAAQYLSLPVQPDRKTLDAWQGTTALPAHYDECVSREGDLRPKAQGKTLRAYVRDPSLELSMPFTRTVTMLALAREALERFAITPMPPKPIYPNDWSMMSSFGRL
jgi:hypothetical protein